MGGCPCYGDVGEGHPLARPRAGERGAGSGASVAQIERGVALRGAWIGVARRRRSICAGVWTLDLDRGRKHDLDRLGCSVDLDREAVEQLEKTRRSAQNNHRSP